MDEEKRISQETIDSLMKWAMAGDRTWTIEYNNNFGKDKLTFWVYDYDIQEGQYIDAEEVNTFDLIQLKKEKMLNEIERLEELQT